MRRVGRSSRTLRNSRTIQAQIATRSGRDRRPIAAKRRWRLASITVLAAGILVGFLGVEAKDPGSLEQPSLGLALSAFRPPHGVRVFVGVQVPTPGITGCSPWANITLEVTAHTPLGKHEWDRVRRASKRLQFALMVVAPFVRNFHQENRSISESPLPHLPAYHETIDSDHGFTLFLGHDPFNTFRWSRSIDWRVSFDASIVTARSTGSCWVHLPQLLGGNAYNATSAADAMFRAHGPWMFIGGAGPGTQDSHRLMPESHFLVDHGTTALAGADIDVADSRPAPTNGVDEWTCERHSATRDVGCGAVVSVTAPWQGSVKDAMLLLAGVLLSIAAELFFRALRD